MSLCNANDAGTCNIPSFVERIMLGDVADSNSEAGLLIGPVLYQELSHMCSSLAFALIGLIFSVGPILVEFAIPSQVGSA